MKKISKIRHKNNQSDWASAQRDTAQLIKLDISKAWFTK